MQNQNKDPDPPAEKFNLPPGPEHSYQARKSPLKITIIYALFGAIWIVLSDKVAVWIFSGQETYVDVQTVKGLFYIGATSLLVYWLARRSLIKMENEQLENQLQHAERLFKAILDSLGEAVIIVEPAATRTIAECNPAAERMFGYRRDELTDRSTEVLHVDSESFQAFGALGERILEEQGVFQTEFRMKRKNGTIIDTEITLTPMDKNLGWKGRVVAIVRDVTTQKRDQKILADKEEKYRLLADNTLDVIWALTIDFEFAYVNPAVEPILGYKPEEFIGTNLQDHCDEATFAELRQALEEELATPSKSGVLLEIEMLSKDGSLVPLEIHGQLIFDQQGKPIAIQGTSRDIAKRQEAKRQLEYSEGRFRTLFEKADEGIIIADAETGHFIFANPAMSRLLGYSQEELTRIGVEDIHPKEVLPHILGKFYSLNEGGRLASEAPCLRNDGTIMYADIKGVSMEIDGRPCNVGFFTDVTEIREARQQQKALLDRITSLHRIDQMITALPPLEMALQQVVRETVQNLDVDAANVLKLEEPQHRLESYAKEGFSSSQASEMVLHLDEGYAGHSMMEKETITASNIQAEEEKFTRKEMARAEGFHGYACCPIVSRGKVIGVLEVFRRSFSPPSSEQLEFLETLAHQAAIAIDNITSLEELQSANERLLLAYDANIEGWSRALDYRDKETEGHSRRVTEITVELAKRVDVDENQLRYIRWGALLHDIGKMGVPDHILLKPGKLDDEEWEIMKRHPVIARDLMGPIKFLEPAIDIPYCHHEKWDGSGYPRGLKGEDIPIAARIFAVADVWDALRSDRPYRERWPKEKALGQLKEMAGSHLDPEIVKVFRGCLDDIPACS